MSLLLMPNNEDLKKGRLPGQSQMLGLKGKAPQLGAKVGDAIKTGVNAVRDYAGQNPLVQFGTSVAADMSVGNMNTMKGAGESIRRGVDRGAQGFKDTLNPVVQGVKDFGAGLTGPANANQLTQPPATPPVERPATQLQLGANPMVTEQPPQAVEVPPSSPGAVEANAPKTKLEQLYPEAAEYFKQNPDAAFHQVQTADGVKTIENPNKPPEDYVDVGGVSHGYGASFVGEDGLKHTTENISGSTPLSKAITVRGQTGTTRDQAITSREAIAAANINSRERINAANNARGNSKNAADKAQKDYKAFKDESQFHAEAAQDALNENDKLINTIAAEDANVNANTIYAGGAVAPSSLGGVKGIKKHMAISANSSPERLAVTAKWFNDGSAARLQLFRTLPVDVREALEKSLGN